MQKTRQIAFEVLYKVHFQKSYSNLLLDSSLNNHSLDRLEKRFVSRLVYGVIERMKLLDFNLSLYLKQPLKKLKPQVLTALRMGAYEILFSDAVPDSAAVNESVEIVKKNSCAFASGLVNAVLRNISRNDVKFPDENSEDYLSIKYSCEKWICDEWTNHFGKQQAVMILENSIGAAPIYIKVNTLKISVPELQKKLEEENIKSSLVPTLEDALEIEPVGSPADSDCFREGLFHVQDLSSQIACRLVDAKSGEKVLDVCAAPGGKSFTLCQNMNGVGRLVSCDIYPQRLKLIEQGAERLGIDIVQTVLNDASVENSDFDLFDKVLCDVPCSGLGIIRRKPEIRYKLVEDIDKLVDLQYHILCV
ncbi:MAG: 16S rRNA (cytosine(967)-C(5))-methyltransferase RsmB, partial [Clostridia bacterium]|nr:16S rRNA (cytosine(967)-C(5))-methyltransferase RsmB [Clostridia bacterium]